MSTLKPVSNTLRPKKAAANKQVVIGTPKLLADTSGLATAAPLRKVPLPMLIKERYIQEMKSRAFTPEEVNQRNS